MTTATAAITAFDSALSAVARLGNVTLSASPVRALASLDDDGNPDEGVMVEITLSGTMPVYRHQTAVATALELMAGNSNLPQSLREVSVTEWGNGGYMLMA